jgi:large subunit ribosomal protein L33
MVRLPWPNIGRAGASKSLTRVFEAANSLFFLQPNVPTANTIMREYVWLECTSCHERNYRTQKETRGAERLELKKYCRRERKHTLHKESRKK